MENLCKDCEYWSGIGFAENGGWCEKKDIPVLYNDKCDDLFLRGDIMKLYAARDKNTGKLVADLTSPGHKFWHRRADCETAIRNYNMSGYKHRNYDLELVVYELVEVTEGES